MWVLTPAFLDIWLVPVGEKNECMYFIEIVTGSEMD
jgi:hypothetical protein